MEMVAAAMTNHSPRCSWNLIAAGMRSAVTTAMEAMPHISSCAKLTGKPKVGKAAARVRKTSHPTR